MKTTSLLRLMPLVLGVGGVGVQSAWAVAGVADTTVVIEDVSVDRLAGQENWNWEQNFANQGQQLSVLKNLLDRAEKTVELLGTPTTKASDIVGSVSDIMKPVNDAVQLETSKHAIESSANLFGMGSTSRKVYRQTNKVETSYGAFGKSVTRDEKRYSHLAMREAVYARCRTAATNEETVDQKETALQQGTLEKLKTATTHAEIALLAASLSASQQRQSIAHQKAMEARAEAENFEAQLAVETDRKSEADREWTQTVVDRLREKALASYQAQAGGGVAATDN